MVRNTCKCVHSIIGVHGVVTDFAYVLQYCDDVLEVSNMEHW